MSAKEEFIKAKIRSKIDIADPEVYEKLIDIIYKFALVLMYADENMKQTIIDIVFSVVPENVIIDLVRKYISTIKSRYDIIKNVISSSGLIETLKGGKSIEDTLLSAMISMYMQQLQSQQTTTQQPGTVPAEPGQAKIKEVPKELKEMLSKLE